MIENELIDLVNAAKKKDNAAMETLYKEFYSDVMFVCSKFNLGKEDSQDIAQETFIKAFSSLSGLQDNTKFKQWICRIADNKCMDLLKHNKIITFDSIDDTDNAVEIPDKSKNIEEMVIEKETSEVLSGLMEKLPVEQRITLFLYFYQDYSVKEIAALYGCSESTVRSRLCYAKKFMQNEIEKMDSKETKHRCIALLPFLFCVFANERKAFACEIPSSTLVVAEAMKTGASNAASQTGTVMTAAKNAATAGMSVGKIAAIVAASVALAAGGIFSAIHFSGDKGKKTNDSPANSVDISDKTDSGDNLPSDTDNITADSEVTAFITSAIAVLDNVENVGTSYNELISGKKGTSYIGMVRSTDQAKLIDTRNLIMESMVEEEYELFDLNFIDTVDNHSYIYEDKEDCGHFTKRELTEDELKAFSYCDAIKAFYDNLLKTDAKLSTDENGKSVITFNAQLDVLAPIYDLFFISKNVVIEDTNFELMKYSGEFEVFFDESMYIKNINFRSQDILEDVAKAWGYQNSEIEWQFNRIYFNFAYNYETPVIPEVVDIMTDTSVILGEYENGASARCALRTNNHDNNVKIVLCEKRYSDRDEKYSMEDILKEANYEVGYYGKYYFELKEDDVEWTTINGYETGIAEHISEEKNSEDLIAIVKCNFNEEERIALIIVSDEYTGDTDGTAYAKRMEKVEEIINSMELINISNPTADRNDAISKTYGL